MNLGWCVSPLVAINTENSDSLPTRDIAMASGVPSLEKAEEAVERSSLKDFSILVRLGRR